MYVCVGAESCKRNDAEKLIGGEGKAETFNQHHTGLDLGAYSTPPLTILTGSMKNDTENRKN